MCCGRVKNGQYGGVVVAGGVESASVAVVTGVEGAKNTRLVKVSLSKQSYQYSEFYHTHSKIKRRFNRAQGGSRGEVSSAFKASRPSPLALLPTESVLRPESTPTPLE